MDVAQRQNAEAEAVAFQLKLQGRQTDTGGFWPPIYFWGISRSISIERLNRRCWSMVGMVTTDIGSRYRSNWPNKMNDLAGLIVVPPKHRVLYVVVRPRIERTPQRITRVDLGYPYNHRMLSSACAHKARTQSSSAMAELLVDGQTINQIPINQ